MCGNIFPIQRKRKQSKVGLSRNQNLKTPDIEPNDEEFKLTMKAARRELEVPMPAAMLCKIPMKSSGETHRNAILGNARHITLVLSMPTIARDQGSKELDTNLIKITLLRKGCLQHQLKSSRCKGGSGERMEILENSGMAADESQKHERSDHWSKDWGLKSSLCVIDGSLCHLKNSELEPQCQKYNGRVVLRGDIVKHDSGSYAVFTEQGSSASHMTAAKVMDILSRLPGSSGQAADAVSACTQVKMENASTLLQSPKSECPDFGYYRSAGGRNHGLVWKTQSFLSEGICTVTLWQDFHVKGNMRKFYWNTVGKKF